MENNVYKIIIIGKEGVGKEELIKSIGMKRTRDTKDIVGVSINDYIVKKYNKEYKMHLWDLMAEKKFETIYRRFFRGAAAAILMFNPSDVKTFDYCKEQLTRIRKNVRNICPFILIGNKMDRAGKEQEVKKDIYVQFAKNKGAIGYIELKDDKIQGFKQALEIILDSLIDLSVIDLFSNDLKLKIIMLLSTYRELSLAEISNYLSKSKATISRYTRKLIPLGIIKSYTKENEVTPGSIDKKYYALNEDFFYPELLSFECFDTNSGKGIVKLQYELKKKLFLFLLYEELSKIGQNFIQNFPQGREGLIALTFLALNEDESSAKYTNIIDTILQTSINIRFIRRDQFIQLQSLRKDFNEKLKDILKKEDDARRDYIYIDMILPFLQLMNIEKSDKDRRLETIDSLSKTFKKKY